MSARVVPFCLIGGAVVGVGALTRRYRLDLAAAHARLATVDRSVITTEYGPLEFAEQGTGDPILVSHGIFHGCDGALSSIPDLATDHRVVAPSRFGYLGSALLPAATVADQSDSFAALLDHLQLETVAVIGISAGTGAAVQLALRHPDRVSRLVISSGNLPGNTTAEAPPSWARLFYSDRAMWALKTFARPMFAKLMGVPKGFPRSDVEARVVGEMLTSIFPIGPRAEGAIFDAYVSNPEINTYPLEALQVPTLLIHAKDDPLASYDAAAMASARIPNSVLLSLESGGHLQLGQAGRVRTEISSFLARPATT